jgi:hypothetical protein
LWHKDETSFRTTPQRRDPAKNCAIFDGVDSSRRFADARSHQPVNPPVAFAHARTKNRLVNSRATRAISLFRGAFHSGRERNTSRKTGIRARLAISHISVTH